MPFKRSFPLRAHLLVLLVGTLLPALVLAAVLVRRVVDANEAAVEGRLLETARAEAAVVDAELSGTIRALQALSQTDELTTGDLPGFRAEAHRLQLTQPSWDHVVLHGADGLPAVETDSLEGLSADVAIDTDTLARLRRTNLPFVGGLRRAPGGVAGLSFPVRVPVIREGRLVYIVSALITPASLSTVLRRRDTVSDEWVRGVVDSSGLVVTRSRDADRFVGQKGTPEFLRRFVSTDEAVYRDTSLEGMPVYGAFARAPMSGWIAGVAVPAAVVDAAFRQSIYTLAGFGLLLLGLGCGGAFLISRNISRDIARAAASAHALAGGTFPEMPRSSVSEVQQLREGLARSAALLDARQRERDEQVARADAARAEAEAADQAKDDFLAMLGHELRNPLAPVLTALELMRRRGDAGAGRERDIIERQVRHLVRLVDDLLDVSRVRRGRVELRRQPFELSRAIEKAVEIAAPLISQREHRLTVRVPATGLVVHGDETRLAQVFANLLTNAAKYSPQSGEIRLHGVRLDGSAVITCEDSGVGIDRELLAKVFDLFVQGRQPLDRREGGLGLGLAVAKTLVELHGGSIEAASAGPGRGSTFTVRLPLSTLVPGDSQPPDASRAERNGNGRRVLVVDDNTDAAEVLAEMLRLAGYEVRTEFDGVQALAAAEAFEPSIAILDVGLPSLDGLELARRLRASRSTRSLVLIAVTGYGQDGDIAASYAAGFDRHLVKPVAAEALFDALRSTDSPASPLANGTGPGPGFRQS